jgi:hypothetical protein
MFLVSFLISSFPSCPLIRFPNQTVTHAASFELFPRVQKGSGAELARGLRLVEYERQRGRATKVARRFLAHRLGNCVSQLIS